MESSFKYGLAACAKWLLYFVRLLNKPLKLFVATTLVLSALLGDALPEKIYTYIITYQLEEARFSTVTSLPSSLDIQTHSSSTSSSQVVSHPSTDLAQCCLTAEFTWALVKPNCQGRW